MTTYYVDAEWSIIVPEGDPRAAFGVSDSDIDRLGLREKLDAFLAPPAPPAAPAPPKQAKRGADKMLRAHEDK